MATFEYEALTASGRLMTGKVEADSHEQARQMLAGMQLAVQSISQAAPRPRTAIGRSELLLFNQQLAAIARAGIPLERSLRELAADAASPRMRRLIESVAGELESGTPLHEAFEKHQRDFPPLYARIIEAGVRSGRLGEMLTSLNRHSEIAAQTRRIVFEALCYPMVVLALSAVVLTCLFVYVVPRFSELYVSLGHRLPPATAALVAVSDHIGAIWIGIAVVLALLVVAHVLLGRSPAGRRFMEAVLLHIPVFGRIHRDATLSRATDSLALLVGAGCDMPACLRLSGAAAGSEWLKRDIELVAQHVESGGRITEAPQPAGRVVPALLLYSIDVGSQRNELGETLYGLSEMYGNQAKANQGRLQAVLMPVMLILVGGLLGFAIVSMFLPVLRLLQIMHVGVSP